MPPPPEGQMTDKLIESADLKFVDITKKFGKVTAVNNVSLQVHKGEMITLLGPSGCGKTTILRMIAGLEVPTSGKILLGGEDITQLPANERKITMVFQSYALFPHMNVFENIAYGLRVQRMKDAEIRDAIEETLALVGLEGLAKRGASELSGGQQQRVALARALILKPKVLLFDEPLSNLDAKLRNRMRGEIRNLQQELGITSVYVTHDQAEALAISDRIVVMDNAVISQIGSPTELYTQPANPFVADFIGDANIVEAVVVGESKGLAVVDLAGTELKVNYRTLPPKGTRVNLMIRPEDILFTDKKKGLTGTVEFAMYQGAMDDYILSTPGGELRLHDYAYQRTIRPRGTEVRLQFREEHTFLIGEKT